MPTSTLRIGLEQAAAAVRALGPRSMEAAKRAALATAYRAQAALVRATGQAGPANPSGLGTGGAVNTGHYKRSWKAEALPDGARVYNDAPYAAVIEHGRRAGGRGPPLAAIRDWAMRRLGLSPEQAARAAFPIARAIAARGLLPRQVLGQQLPAITEWLREAVEEELAKELKKGASR